MSASAFFFSGSSTKTHCQPWALEPVGACSARSRHSISTSRGTGFSRSSRLRTERVVVRTSSTDRFKVISPRLQSRNDSPTDARGFQQAPIRPLRMADHRRQIRPARAATGVVLPRRHRRDRVLDAERREGQAHRQPSAGEPEPGLRRQRRRHHRRRRQRSRRRRRRRSPQGCDRTGPSTRRTPSSSG